MSISLLFFSLSHCSIDTELRSCFLSLLPRQPASTPASRLPPRSSCLGRGLTRRGRTRVTCSVPSMPTGVLVPPSKKKSGRYTGERRRGGRGEETLAQRKKQYLQPRVLYLFIFNTFFFLLLHTVSRRRFFYCVLSNVVNSFFSPKTRPGFPKRGNDGVV